MDKCFGWLVGWFSQKRLLSKAVDKCFGLFVLVSEGVDKCFGLFVCLFSQKKLVSEAVDKCFGFLFVFTEKVSA